MFLPKQDSACRTRDYVFDGHMRHGPADLGRDGAQRQAIAAQGQDLVNHYLLLWSLDKYAFLTDPPPKWRSTAEKPTTLLLIGFGSENPLSDAVTLGVGKSDGNRVEELGQTVGDVPAQIDQVEPRCRA